MKVMVFAVFSFFAGHVLAAECSVVVNSTDQMKFDVAEIVVDKSCQVFTVELKHVGSLPKAVMGHNWVLSKAEDSQAIVTDGVASGLQSDYLKPGDHRVIAKTRIIGGGEADSVRFDVSKLVEGQKYKFFCSFPGHLGMMQGALVLK